jgi:hypothetical protein
MEGRKRKASTCEWLASAQSCATNQFVYGLACVRGPVMAQMMGTGMIGSIDQVRFYGRINCHSNEPDHALAFQEVILRDLVTYHYPATRCQVYEHDDARGHFYVPTLRHTVLSPVSSQLYDYHPPGSSDISQSAPLFSETALPNKISTGKV